MGVDPESEQNVSADIALRVLDDFAEMIEQVLEEKRRKPGDDHLSWLVAREAEGLLTPEDLEQNSERLFKAASYNPQVSAISWMGDIFLRSLRMLIIPLILSKS